MNLGALSPAKIGKQDIKVRELVLSNEQFFIPNAGNALDSMTWASEMPLCTGHINDTMAEVDLLRLRGDSTWPYGSLPKGTHGQVVLVQNQSYYGVSFTNTGGTPEYDGHGIYTGGYAVYRCLAGQSFWMMYDAMPGKASYLAGWRIIGGRSDDFIQGSYSFLSWGSDSAYLIGSVDSAMVADSWTLVSPNQGKAKIMGIQSPQTSLICQVKLLTNDAVPKTAPNLIPRSRTDNPSSRVQTTVTLVHEDPYAATSSRIHCPGGRDYTLQPQESVLAVYDMFRYRWRVIASEKTWETDLHTQYQGVVGRNSLVQRAI